ncbi:SAUR family [Musa troglodytarum]|uniref:SAUR family n=1 Tax=Musa troglodytarum TaxID=320322 RepID=A0A9E7F1Q6_9LILI|nr:SAUR family [Musa troglodytarum]
MIPVTHLYHPLLAELLDKAQEVHDHHSAGPLRLPCSVDDFLHIRRLIGHQSSCSCTCC